MREAFVKGAPLDFSGDCAKFAPPIVVAPQDITLAIIAGGRARRLGGVDKTLLHIGSSTILAQLIELKRWCAHTMLITNRPLIKQSPGPATLTPDIVTHADIVPNKGVPGGIVTALLLAETPWVLAVGGDMPFIRSRHVETLLRAAASSHSSKERAERHASAEPAPIVVAARAGAIEPLFGLYRSTLGEVFRQKLESNPSMRSLVASVHCLEVEVEAAALESINTPEDLERARRTSR
jgi:molybdopterin-guanine dinucleotide biosynthesis protein A